MESLTPVDLTDSKLMLKIKKRPIMTKYVTIVKRFTTVILGLKI